MTDQVESSVPPHDLRAEAAVLSGAMNDSVSLDIAAEIITSPEQFYSEAHRRMWEAALYLHARGERVDVITIASRLRETDRLAQVGGMAYLTDVLNAAPGLAGVRKYAETVFETFKVRQLILTCQRVSAQGYAGYGDATSFINMASQAVFDIESDGSRTELEQIKPILHAALSKVSAANARGAHITGTPTGFDRYDRITSGLHGGELTIFAARPGMSKTSLLLDVGQNVADHIPGVMDGQKPEPRYGVAIFSLEMPKDQVALRLLCSRAHVEVGKVRTGMLTQTDWAKLTSAAAHLAALPLFIDDQSSISMTQLRAKARRKAAELAARRPDEMYPHGVKLALVGVDYLQLMEGMGDEQSREQEVSKISRGLKIMSKDLGIPVIALSQLNRQVETRGTKNKRPQLSDLRESEAIEQDADNICFVFREDYYDKETAERNIAELIIAKQRNGPTDTVRVRWDAQYTRFDNLADGEYQDDYHGG